MGSRLQEELMNREQFPQGLSLAILVHLVQLCTRNPELEHPQIDLLLEDFQQGDPNTSLIIGSIVEWLYKQ